MGENKVKFGVKIEKVWPKAWSFGVCLSHFEKETYLYINLFKFSFSIGWLETEEHNDET